MPSMPSFALYSIVAGFVVLCILKTSVNKNKSLPPLPPGPKGYPLIGNLYDIPTNMPWVTYQNWKRKYGDIFSFTVFGKTTIVLNSFTAANELLDKRSSNFSGRPRLVRDFFHHFPRVLYKYIPRRLWQMNFLAGSGILRICPIQIVGGE